MGRILFFTGANWLFTRTDCCANSFFMLQDSTLMGTCQAGLAKIARPEPCFTRPFLWKLWPVFTRLQWVVAGPQWWFPDGHRVCFPVTCWTRELDTGTKHCCLPLSWALHSAKSWIFTNEPAQQRWSLPTSSSLFFLGHADSNFQILI